MGDIEIGSVNTLHSITGGNPNFTGNVHIQSNNGDFMFGYPSQSEIDEGEIKFTMSQGGHAMIPVVKTGLGLVALKSESPMTVRIWTDSISQPNQSSKQEGQVLSSSYTDSKKYISVVLWVGVIIALLLIIGKKK